MSLGFNLAGSLAAIDQWVQDMSSGDDEEAEVEDLTNGKPKRNKEKKESKIQIIGVPSYNNSNDKNNKDKILSRDTIINMVRFISYSYPSAISFKSHLFS